MFFGDGEGGLVKWDTSTGRWVGGRGGEEKGAGRGRNGGLVKWDNSTRRWKGLAV